MAIEFQEMEKGQDINGTPPENKIEQPVAPQPTEPLETPYQDSLRLEKVKTMFRNRFFQEFPKTPRKVCISTLATFMLKNITTPASSMKARHGCFEGGLAVHIMTVSDIAQGLWKASEWCFDPLYYSSVSAETWDMIALIHDLNKVCDLTGTRYYVPNILKNGLVSEKKPAEINKNLKGIFSSLVPQNITSMPELIKDKNFDDLVVVPDGVTSLLLAEKEFPGTIALLTEEEKVAIIFHDGMYSHSGRQSLMGKENALQIIFHAADMMASRITKDSLDIIEKNQKN